MWVRGLKHQLRKGEKITLYVAPHVGAWIETQVFGSTRGHSKVAPHVGAWIETTVTKISSSTQCVAPHVGAWIETLNQDAFYHPKSSHPMWVRGLKQRGEKG